MDELITAVGELLDATPGGYVSKAKVRALLERHAAAGDRHDHHMHLLVGSSQICGCGEDVGVIGVAISADPTQIEHAYAAAGWAYIEKVRELAERSNRGDHQPFGLNGCIAAAVDAALGVHGIEVPE